MQSFGWAKMKDIDHLRDLIADRRDQQNEY